MNRYITSNTYISTSALYSPNEAYLEHGLFNWGKHKYIKRTGTPGHYVYTYAEDLKNSGRKLVSNARDKIGSSARKASKSISTVARKVGDAVGSVTGSTQDRRARQALVARNAANTQQSRNAAIVRKTDRNNDAALKRYSKPGAHNYDSLLKSLREENAATYDNYYNSVDRAREAQAAYNRANMEAYDAPVRKAIRAIKDIPFNISLEVEDAVQKVKDKIGIGYRDSIIKARRKRDRYDFNADLYEMYDQQYRNVCYDYGQTFMGNMERVFNTQYYKDILRKI